ncbi:MAG: zinc ribbon domain-containing protein [Firmicutes bacterium]|nr:zinc ribbon domain-containing protein [Bacillota bacterium]
MPLYEFKCKKCAGQMEQLCKMGESGEELVCAHCGCRGLERIVSSFAAPGIKGGDKCGGCPGGNCSSC